jgi:hypothetical protein
VGNPGRVRLSIRFDDVTVRFAIPGIPIGTQYSRAYVRDASVASSSCHSGPVVAFIPPAGELGRFGTQHKCANTATVSFTSDLPFVARDASQTP